MSIRDNSVFALFDRASTSPLLGLDLNQTGAGTIDSVIGTADDILSRQLSNGLSIIRSGTDNDTVLTIALINQSAGALDFAPMVVSALNLRLISVGTATAKIKLTNAGQTVVYEESPAFPIFNPHEDADNQYLFPKIMEHPTHVFALDPVFARANTEEIVIEITGTGNIFLGRFWASEAFPIRMFRESVKVEYIDNSVQLRTEGEQSYTDSRAIVRKVSAILPDLTDDEIYGSFVSASLGELRDLDRIVRQVGQSIPWLLVPDPKMSETDPEIMARTTYYGAPVSFGPMTPIATDPMRRSWSFAMQEER